SDEAHSPPPAPTHNLTHGPRGLPRHRPPLSLTQETRRNVSVRAVIDRTVVHISDIREEPDFSVSQRLGDALRFRAILSVPMLRDGSPIGAISIARAEAGFFSSSQVDLLQTFADQAVIAIENVRLFTELQEKNRALTQAHAQVSEALEPQTATSEILPVLASSPTDVQPVFDIIAESAVRLCGAEVSNVTRFDGEWVHIGAIYDASPTGVEAMKRIYPMPPTGVGGAARAIRDRAIVHIPD